MVDVSAKPVTDRLAVAVGAVRMSTETLALITEGRAKKGDVLSVARLAGIMAAKKTSELIPLCHTLSLSHCEVTFETPETRDRLRILARASTVAGTGVEMEALTAVSVAALTVYDMCKAVDRGMIIGEIRLERKTKGPI